MSGSELPDDHPEEIGRNLKVHEVVARASAAPAAEDGGAVALDELSQQHLRSARQRGVKWSVREA